MPYAGGHGFRRDEDIRSRLRTAKDGGDAKSKEVRASIGAGGLKGAVPTGVTVRKGTKADEGEKVIPALGFLASRYLRYNGTCRS